VAILRRMIVGATPSAWPSRTDASRQEAGHGPADGQLGHPQPQNEAEPHYAIPSLPSIVQSASRPSALALALPARVASLRARRRLLVSGDQCNAPSRFVLDLRAEASLACSARIRWGLVGNFLEARPAVRGQSAQWGLVAARA
jgi:hypothetical protein